MSEPTDEGTGQQTSEEMGVAGAKPPEAVEWCPLFTSLRCDQISAIEIYGMALDRDGKPTGVLLGSASPETTADDIQRDFGGGRFELKTVSHRGGGSAYHKMRGLHLPGEPKWKDSVSDLKDDEAPGPVSRTGSLLGAQRPPMSPPNPYAGGGFARPGYPMPPGGAPPGYAPGALGGGYGGMPPAYGGSGFGHTAQATAAGGPVVPIPKEGGVAPGLPPQQAQAVIEREMEERRSREDQRIMMESQERAIDRTVAMTATLANMFRGDNGSNDQRIQWYAGELQRKNSEIDQVRMTYTSLLQQKEQEIFQLRQQLIQAQQLAQTEVLKVQQENMQLKSQIDGMGMQMRLGMPQDKGPSPMLQMAGPAISALAAQPAVGNAVANLLGALGGAMSGGGGGALPGSGG